MQIPLPHFSPRLLLWLLLPACGCARSDFFQPDARLGDASVPLAPTADSVRATAGRHYNRHGGSHLIFLGRHYRTVWAAPVSAPVLKLATAVPGGLKAGKIGGGFQSISMTLDGPNGREYALRALDKAPDKTLPIGLRKSFLLNMLRDATSAVNPYGALTVPPLARAAGVPHSSPRLVYVRPDATDLGEASARFQGKLALLEEKYEGPADRTAAFAGATTFLESEEMLKKLYEAPTHTIDQPAFLRARLLDLWIGDWDRHEGQWQWAQFDLKNGATRYQGIAKDRDQVYFRFNDGVLPWLATRRFGNPKFQTFRPKYGYIPGLVSQARFIDQRALSQMTRADFQRTAAELQRRWPDTLIERAARRMPPAVYALEGPQLVAALRTRRETLPQAVEEYYQDFVRKAAVGGTNRPERFVVDRYRDSTVVRIERISTNNSPVAAAETPGNYFYRRTFLPKETKNLTLEGLGGDDVFTITTHPKAHPLPVAVFGGTGSDTVKLIGRPQNLQYYDADATANSPLRVRTPPKKHRPYDRLSKE